MEPVISDEVIFLLKCCRIGGKRGLELLRMLLEMNGFLFIYFSAPRLRPRLLYLVALRIYGRAEKCNNLFCGVN